MNPDGYYFGTRLAKRLDYYAFPRTGSHYLWTCLTGLFDLVFYPNEHVQNPEAVQRADELNPHAVYAMKLREDGVPYQPVYINADPNGTHGLPTKGAHPVLLLIRDPHPTIYSWYHTATERWGAQIPDVNVWLRDAYAQYTAFYDQALAVVAAHPTEALLIRYETLKDDPAVLRQIATFVGVQPKLTADFVHWWTNFDRMTRPGPRTFYRAGHNQHWAKDAAWLARVRAVAPGDFTRFGYPDAP